MAYIWENKAGKSSTAWTADSSSTTAWNESSGAGNYISDNSEQESVIGTFSTSAKATTSILGTKYHLFDNKVFALGTDRDFTLKFNSITNGFNIDSTLTSDKFFSITKGNASLMILDSDGDLKINGAFDTPTVKTQASLSGSPASGSLTFYNNDLYISKE
tara:strand:+ start:138 stop:617 length:480 start_codon:yes stop_codon:yes gene_type:complete